MKHKPFLITSFSGLLIIYILTNISILYCHTINFTFPIIPINHHPQNIQFVFTKIFSSRILFNNLEIKNAVIKKQDCDFKEIFHLFSHHKMYYPEITRLKNKEYQNINTDYSCEQLKQTIINREHKRWNEFRISPIEEKQGVTDPIIILYGRYIKPPYRIEKDNETNTISLNGIQIFPRLHSPQMEPDEGEIFSMKAMDYEGQIIEIEKILKKLWKDYLQNNINNDLKGHDRDWVLKELESSLQNLRERGKIKAFYIYDRERILFDILMPYSETYDDIPPKYMALLEGRKPIDQWPSPSNEIKSVESSEEMLEIRYENLIKNISNHNIHIFTFDSELSNLSYTKESFYKIIHILNLPVSEYEKVKMMDGMMDNEIAIELVFNLSGENLMYLTQRFDNDKQ